MPDTHWCAMSNVQYQKTTTKRNGKLHKKGKTQMNTGSIKRNKKKHKKVRKTSNKSEKREADKKGHKKSILWLDDVADREDTLKSLFMTRSMWK